MISVKKLLLKTIEGTKLRIQTAAINGFAPNAGGDATITTTLSISSGTPVGIVGYALAGTRASSCFVSELHLNGTSGSCTMKIHNTASSQATVSATVFILVRG